MNCSEFQTFPQIRVVKKNLHPSIQIPNPDTDCTDIHFCCSCKKFLLLAWKECSMMQKISGKVYFQTFSTLSAIIQAPKTWDNICWFTNTSYAESYISCVHGYSLFSVLLWRICNGVENWTLLRQHMVQLIRNLPKRWDLMNNDDIFTIKMHLLGCSW